MVRVQGQVFRVVWSECKVKDAEPRISRCGFRCWVFAFAVFGIKLPVSVAWPSRGQVPFHHFRFNVTRECNEEEINEDDGA